MTPVTVIRPALAALAATALLAAAAPPSDAAFPGRDGKLVFGWSSFSESELEPFPSRTETAIQTVRPRGGRPVTLRGCVRETGKADVGDCSIAYGSPAVSPSGQWVAFDAGNRLGLMRADGTRFRLLASHSADDGQPAFAPSGKRLAFAAGAVAVVQQPAPPRGVWTSDLAGGAARQLTANGDAPAWSTRNWIAFLRADGVYRARPDGRGLRRLVHRARCSDVAWSPHGTKLAFTCGTPHSGGRLYVANGDGSHVRRVLVRYASPQSVAWAPSGRRLAVVSFDGSILIVRLDGRQEPGGIGGGSGATYTFGAGSVDWQPLR
ncbi:MAG: PD40 domain-containing protein [Actinobacteria bacterium]|nr:PD40 domain-containing protein [Actinomycetota bacterium]